MSYIDPSTVNKLVIICRLDYVTRVNNPSLWSFYDELTKSPYASWVTTQMDEVKVNDDAAVFDA